MIWSDDEEKKERTIHNRLLASGCILFSFSGMTFLYLANDLVFSASSYSRCDLLRATPPRARPLLRTLMLVFLLVVIKCMALFFNKRSCKATTTIVAKFDILPVRAGSFWCWDNRPRTPAPLLAEEYGSNNFYLCNVNLIIWYVHIHSHYAHTAACKVYIFYTLLNTYKINIYGQSNIYWQYKDFMHHLYVAGQKYSSMYKTTESITTRKWSFMSSQSWSSCLTSHP